MFKKVVATILCSVLVIGNSLSIQAASDETALISAVANKYVGRTEAKGLINNLNFADVPENYWAEEAIVRLGALGIVKGYSSNGKNLYRPNDIVQKQEALAFILRGLGYEAQAQLQAEQIAATQGNTAHILDLWSRGYLSLAAQFGLITQGELADALVPEQDLLNPEYSFIRGASATREEAIVWLVKAINRFNPGVLQPTRGQNLIYDYKDWATISESAIPYVETALQNQLISGFKEDNTFRPKGNLTRAQMAQIIKNVDDIYYTTQNISKKNGIVANVKEEVVYGATKNTYRRVVKIRNEEGKIDEVSTTFTKDSIQQTESKDVVVLKDHKVQGLEALNENDRIEYLVNDFDKTMLYILNQGEVQVQEVRGRLRAPTDFEKGLILLQDSQGKSHQFTLIDGLYGQATNAQGQIYNYLLVDGKKVNILSGLYDQWIALTLQNNIVTELKYIGQPVVNQEIKGTVIENNPLFGYIKIRTIDNEIITKKYYKDQVKVEKTYYYNSADEVGYYDEVFDSYSFDPRDSAIEDIDPGDVVYLILNKNQEYVDHISAEMNFNMYYGNISRITPKGVNGTKIEMVLEDKTRFVFTLNKDVPIFKNEQQQSLDNLHVGDWVKVLANHGIINPGHEIITVKELVIDNRNTLVANVYKGQIAYINNTQNLAYINNVQQLSKLGWINYQQQKTLDLSDENIEYYENGKQVSKDYFNHYLKFTGNVYVAMEKKYDHEIVKMVSFRGEQDKVLEKDYVSFSNGGGKLKLRNEKRDVYTDDGTIIIRNGRLVTGQNIMTPDYVQVVLNGYNKAGVIDITEQPMNDAIKVYRGRVASIEEGVSFQVQSHAELENMTWSYSPVKSRFTFDYNTVFLDENGLVNFTEFMDYTEQSKINEVYTIFTQGTTAKYVVKEPYVREGVRGQIYNIEGNTIKLRDTFYYNRGTKSWKDFSNKNVGSIVDLQKNVVIIKEGKLVSADALEIGDKIRVMSDENLKTISLTSGTSTVKGFIIFVEG